MSHGPPSYSLRMHIRLREFCVGFMLPFLWDMTLLQGVCGYWAFQPVKMKLRCLETSVCDYHVAESHIPTESSSTKLSKSREQQRGHRPLLHGISKQSGSFVDAKHLVVEVTETRSANCRRVMNLEESCISTEPRMRRYEGFLNHDSQSHAIT